jgi:hypothetical protein
LGKIKRCPDCGVPGDFSKGNAWNDDGTVTQIRNPDNRVCFHEAEGLNQLFANIQELVGVPIDRIVAEGKRKASLDYVQHMYPGFKRTVMRLFRRRVYESIAGMGALFGLGHYELLDFKKGEYIKVYGRNVYSPFMFGGDLVAVFNFVEGLPADLCIEEKDGGYLVTVGSGEDFEEEISSRLGATVIPSKPGDIRYDRCPRCGMPLDFKEYEWDPGEGVVTDMVTGRHMAFTGPRELDTIFTELESELGEEIPNTVLEAQRRYTVGILQKTEFRQPPAYLKRELAKRGLGNVVTFDLEGDRLEAAVENASPYLLVAGILQGVFELVTGSESNCEYSREEDGTLLAIITAA